MANLKFSQFQEQTDSANVQFVVGYNGTDNVRIAPGNLGGYPFLIDTQSLYSGFVPSGLSGNPQGNTVLGISAGNSIVGSFENTLIGDSAGKSITNSSYQNVMVGAHAGEFKSTGSQSTLVGYQAGQNSSGLSNVLIGWKSGRFSTENYTIGIGESTIGAASGGYGSIAIGYKALMNNTADQNISIGFQSGISNTSGLRNINIGYNAGYSNTTGASNTAFGHNTLVYHNGDNNVAIGTDAMKGAGSFTGTGNDNVAIGFNAGSGSLPTAFSNSILIGKDAATSPLGASNFIVLGNSSHTTLQIPGIQSGASDGDVLTFNQFSGKLELQAAGGGGASDLNGLSDVSVDLTNDNAFFINVPSGISGAVGNIGLGEEALNSLTSGDYNTAIGKQALNNSTSSERSTAIGYNAGASAGTNLQLNTVLIGDNAGFGRSGYRTVAVGSGAMSFGLGKTAVNRNTAIGYHALYRIDTNGADNIAIGHEASQFLTTATTNIAIGDNAARSSASNGHISIGYQAGYSQTSGGNNTNVGYKAGYSNSTGSGRTIIGYEAGEFNTGANNTFIGTGTGYGVSGSSTGGNHVAIGYEACNGLLTSGSNVAIGYQAMKDAQYSDDCVVVGNLAMTNVNSGDKNVAIGSRSMQNSSGNQNVCVGYYTGNSMTSGGNNTIVGYEAGKSITNSSANTVLGQNALGYHNGSTNVAIGGNAMVGSASFTGTGTDNVAIGYNAGGTGATAYSNSILIGKDAATSPAGRSNYIVLGNSSQTVLQMPGITSGASNGDVLMYDTANFPFNSLKLYPSGTTPSDARDKKDIEDLPYGLEFINSLKPRKYIWDNRAKMVETESFDEDGNPITITEEFVANEKGTIGFGFIAQELQEVDNEVVQLVNDSNEDSLRINYSKLVPVLVKAIQELKAEIELLKQ